MVVLVCGSDQYDESTRRRLMAYEFTNGFYLPAASPRFEEGFARLDHVQPVFADRLANHRGLKLVPEALDALVEWLIYSTTTGCPRILSSRPTARRCSGSWAHDPRVGGDVPQPQAAATASRALFPRGTEIATRRRPTWMCFPPTWTGGPPSSRLRFARDASVRSCA